MWGVGGCEGNGVMMSNRGGKGGWQGHRGGDKVRGGARGTLNTCQFRYYALCVSEECTHTRL